MALVVAISGALRLKRTKQKSEENMKKKKLETIYSILTACCSLLPCVPTFRDQKWRLPAEAKSVFSPRAPAFCCF
jgi:hypothetical protein